MRKNIYIPDSESATWDRITEAAWAAHQSISEYLRAAAEERMAREAKRAQRAEAAR